MPWLSNKVLEVATATLKTGRKWESILGKESRPFMKL